MKIRLGCALAILLSVLGVAAPADAQKKTLVIALNQDPDVLDPTIARTYVGRIVFAAMCEKLYEIDENLNIYPQLAAEMPRFTDGGKTVSIKLRSGVKFNDGTPLDAAAVKFSLDRHREMKGSIRKSELAPVTEVEAPDPLTVRIRMSKPFSPIVAALADRAGMPISPTQAKKLDEKFGTAPVCVGPWAFTERVAQDRIVLDRSAHYFDPSQAKFDRLIFRIIPDDNVRVANLRSGDVDIAQRLSPTDATSLRKEGKFTVSSVTGIGYDGITINIHNKTGKHAPRGDLGTPLANDPRVREALELSIDRDVLNQVHWEGQYTPGCSPLPPNSPYFDKSRQCSKRDVARAKKLLADAGLGGGYAFELTIVNNPQTRREGEIIQGMAKEVGFNITLVPKEFASALNDNDAGKDQAFVIGWSGRVDPDTEFHNFHACGSGQNQSNVCNEDIDALLNKAREVSDQKERVDLYSKALDKIGARRNIIYLYHRGYIVAFPKNLTGYRAIPDGLIRLKGVSWSN
jgi:peptide/nickel transport system substrate-binding protein